MGWGEGWPTGKKQRASGGSLSQKRRFFKGWGQISYEHVMWIMPKVRAEAERSWNLGRGSPLRRGNLTGALGHGKKLIPQGKGRKGKCKGERVAKSPGSCGGGSVGKAEPDNPEFSPRDPMVEGEN